VFPPGKSLPFNILPIVSSPAKGVLFIAPDYARFSEETPLGAARAVAGGTSPVV
jgi:hypothetical protein